MGPTHLRGRIQAGEAAVFGARVGPATRFRMQPAGAIENHPNAFVGGLVVVLAALRSLGIDARRGPARHGSRGACRFPVDHRVPTYVDVRRDRRCRR